MELDLLLTAETLVLSPSVVKGTVCKDTVAIKCAASQCYITVSRPQLEVLNTFAQPTTIPEALEVCIRSRICIPLREFYDLILKCYEAGILRAELSPPTVTRPAINWVLSIKPVVLLALSGMGFIAAIVLYVLRPPTLEFAWIQLLYGYGAVAGALSLGHVLAAAALRGARCDVYRPHIGLYGWLIPHFAVDLRDPATDSAPGGCGRPSPVGALR